MAARSTPDSSAGPSGSSARLPARSAIRLALQLNVQ
eukprot:CAMPEP_0119057356 /NCGR_PEP_ID=MMETSP1178-20130426/1831_1 /TAXON_ID=33656 /ORGANISM="unid sp, Strain CCMP2000" /LENGTH=35 /DNA_ID= /DNA_START= /DNA_END= /DNA_ORIENTATION=